MQHTFSVIIAITSKSRNMPTLWTKYTMLFYLSDIDHWTGFDIICFILLYDSIYSQYIIELLFFIILHFASMATWVQMSFHYKFIINHCQSIIVCIKGKDPSAFLSKRPHNGKLFQYNNFGFGPFTFNSHGIYASSWFHTSRIIFFAVVAAYSGQRSLANS